MNAVSPLARGLQVILLSIAVNGVSGAQPNATDAARLVSISAGSAHFCALDEQGTVYCWGDGTWGQLGNSSRTSSIGRAGRVSSFQQFRQVVAGSTHTCALTTGGYAYCWGSDASGVMGDATVRERCDGLPCSTVPMPVAMGMRFDSLTAGFEHTCGLSGGRAYCWGRADAGQLGRAGRMQICDGVACSRSPVASLDSARFSSLSARGMHTCGIASDAIVCWGDNEFGQLNESGELKTSALPVRVFANEKATQLSAGGTYSCAVLETGDVLCWGANAFGRLGVADARSAVGRVAAPAGSRFVEVSVGGTHTCAVTDRGAGFCWGSGANGRLGGASSATCGPVECSATPVRVELDAVITHIAAGATSTCATTTTGVVYCWGDSDRSAAAVVATRTHVP